MKFNKSFIVNSLLTITTFISSSSLVMGLNNGEEEDITQEYIKNPSFEDNDVSKLEKDDNRGAYVAPEITGWTVTGSDGKYAVYDIMTSSATATDNNFGAPGDPTDGEQMYYIRNAWEEDEASLLQKVKLSAGKYKLTVDNKFVTAAKHAAYLVAGKESVMIPYADAMSDGWATTELVFILENESEIEIGVSVEFVNASGGSLLVDNFHLYKVPDDYEAPTDDKTETEDKTTNKDSDEMKLPNSDYNKNKDSAAINKYSLNNCFGFILVNFLLLCIYYFKNI